jgi:hypothetical protein
LLGVLFRPLIDAAAIREPPLKSVRGFALADAPLTNEPEPVEETKHPNMG